jgi:hypothetical protein
MPVIIDARRSFGISSIIARPNSEHAFNATDDATDRPADNRADRSGFLTSHISAVRDAVGNALRLRGERRCKRCGDSGRKQDLELHAKTLSSLRCCHMSMNEGVSTALAWRRRATAIKRRDDAK